MAVILYKPGSGHIIRGITCDILVCDEYSYLHNLDQGWFYSPGECYAKEKESTDEESSESADQKKDSEESTETVLTTVHPNNLDDEVRAKAKDASISNWHNKSIKRLVKELGELEDAE